MPSSSDTYLSYTKRKHKRAAMRHWSAQLYLFFITFIFLVIEQLINLPQVTIYIITLSLIALIQVLLIVDYAFARKLASDKKCIVIFVLSIIGCIISYNAYWNNKGYKGIWLFISLMMAAASVSTCSSRDNIHLGSVWRFIKQCISLIAYLLAIWSLMAALASGNIYNACHKEWDRFWIFFQGSIKDNNIPDMTNWISMGLTLLTGCLIVLSWSPNTAHSEWNPYPSYRLDSPHRRALVAFGFLIIIVFSILAKLSRITLLGFFMLLATDITIMIYCYIMQTEEHICTLLAEYILYSETKYLFLSTPSQLYHKMARISQHIIESDKLNMIHEKGKKMIHVLDKVVETYRTIREHGSDEDKADWAFALGFACMPDGRPDGCTVETLKTYYYDIFDYVYRRMIMPERNLDYMACKHILYGLLLGAVQLSTKDEEWQKEFGFAEKGSHYQHCLCLICPTDDMKIYYMYMSKAVMKKQDRDDDSQRIQSPYNVHKDRNNEITSMFCQV